MIVIKQSLCRFNLTDKEGAADRKVPIQPLVFHSKDGNVSRYNLRKVSLFPNFILKRMSNVIFIHVCMYVFQVYIS